MRKDATSADGLLVEVSGGASASFVYDGDGQRVKATFGTSTTVYIGDYYEQEGSTAITANSGGSRVAELRYKACGETRHNDGTTPTAYKFTGQRLDDSTGLYYYGARYYDAALGRFVQPDTIVPDPADPQGLNRYAYVNNNPLKYTDPSGRRLEIGAGFDPDPNYWRDLTFWLVREADYDAALPEVNFMRLNNRLSALAPPGMDIGPKGLAYGMFYELVRDSGPWDFKDKIERRLGESVRLGGYWFEYSTPGNILYGFNGAAAGFSLEELHIGAGVA